MTSSQKCSNTFSHMATLLNTMLPHVDPVTKYSIEIVVKTSELIDSFDRSRIQNDLSTCDLDSYKIDLEAMLTDLQQVTNKQESDLIHMILNMIKARKFYDVYQSTIKKGESDGKSASNSDGFGFMGNNNLIELLKSIMPPEQQATFDNLSMMMNTMSLLNT